MYNPFKIKLTEVERLKDGSWFYGFFGDKNVNGIKNEKERLAAVLTNPAVLKVFKLQCDVFSLGEVKAVRNEKLVPNDKLVSFMKQPNFFQSQRQFLWDYMFWNMLGTAYLYTNSAMIKDSTAQYFLDPSRLVWTDDLIKKLDKIVLSKKTHKELNDLIIQYENLDGTQTPYRLGDIKPFFDLSNGFGNWYRGCSSIDALYKVISNSDKALDAKGINLDFSGKFLVSGQHKEGDIYGTPMATDEKENIESSLRGAKPVHAIKSMVDIKRFVEDIDKLKLDESYFSDYFKIASMYGIPRDVAEAYIQGSTFENQEKSKAAWVEQGLAPKGEDLMDGQQQIFGYNEKNIDLVISWNHLSFMQVFEKERSAVKSTQLNNLSMAKEMGILSEEDVLARGKEIFEV